MTKHLDLTVANKVGEGIRCPVCNSASNGVMDSRPAVLGGGINTIKRRRQCEPCGHRYTTFEISAEIIERLDAVANDRRIPSRREIIESCVDKLRELLP